MRLQEEVRCGLLLLLLVEGRIWVEIVEQGEDSTAPWNPSLLKFHCLIEHLLGLAGRFSRLAATSVTSTASAPSTALADRMMQRVLMASTRVVTVTTFQPI